MEGDFYLYLYVCVYVLVFGKGKGFCMVPVIIFQKGRYGAVKWNISLKL